MSKSYSFHPIPATSFNRLIWEEAGLHPFDEDKGVLQEDRISRLQFQVKTLEKPKVKKRVEKDPNTRLSNIEQITKAIQEAKEETVCIRAKEPELMAKKAANEDLQAGLNASWLELQAY
ncbi:hypothetical protein EYZ11_007001 [Aspergillus tanneri]|uniref:Uncharacterized protein n=1 Tax=Aspergillus tanneri TaxID=1220188 RepID=A0A4S3JEC4_9EURO|nr:hypothetical protein EYZ11_007001 [Aspergillus tanneri]